MVKLILEYDENKLDECTITYCDQTYKTEFLGSQHYANKIELKHALNNLAQEAKYHIKSKIVSTQYWNIVVPTNIRYEYPVSIIRVEDVIDGTYEYIPTTTISINISKFYDIYISLLTEYTTDYIGDHIFLCPEDLKFISNSTETPNKKFSVTIDNIHVHYIPTINVSFIMDNYSLGR